MEIKNIGSIKEYRGFYSSVYGDDPAFKDNKTCLLPLVCGRNGSFYKNSRQEMAAVMHQGKKLCQCVLIIHKNAPDILNMAFFEAMPKSRQAVDVLISYACRVALENGCAKIIAGMDGHLNYSLGFAVDNIEPPSFGESYHPPFYTGYFDGFDKITMSSFKDGIDRVKSRVDRDYNRIAANMACCRIEPAAINRHNLKRYTSLSNAIFDGHPCYYRREYAEDMELFSSMKPILDNDNLIFIKDGHTDIGYVFWYPDYNELVRLGGTFGIAEAVRHRLLHKPRAVKVVEIGVLPGFRNKGIVTLAFKSALDIVLKKYKSAETVLSGWIMDSNIKSMLFVKRYPKNEGRGFTVYEKAIFGDSSRPLP